MLRVEKFGALKDGNLEAKGTRLHGASYIPGNDSTSNIGSRFSVCFTKYGTIANWLVGCFVCLATYV